MSMRHNRDAGSADQLQLVWTAAKLIDRSASSDGGVRRACVSRDAGSIVTATTSSATGWPETTLVRILLLTFAASPIVE